MAEIIPHWLTKQAYLAPNRTAIETIDGNTITFLQLKRKSQSLAKKLATAGVKKGDHIGIIPTNHPSMVITIHALSYLGAVCVLLNSRLTEQELLYQINDANISMIMISDNLAEKIQKMNFPIQTITYSEMKQLREMDIKLKKEIHLDDQFTIMYTSGTTGFPKGVVHTYGNHWWSAIGSALNLGLHQHDKWLATLPIFHISGLSILIRSIIYGMTVLLLEKFDASIINKSVKYHGITIASVVTVMLQQILNDLGDYHYPKSFRCMLLGGGPAPVSLLEKASKHQIPVFQSYGLTETASQIATLSPEDALQKLGSAGKPLFPGQLKIHQPGIDSVGEIYVKGPMVTKGYYQSKEANKKAFDNGWLATGDLGYVDNEGYLYVVDRRVDLIISGGENIYPSEIENIFMGMEGIQDIGVVGQKDHNWGQVPVAFVVKKDKNLLSESIIDYAKKHLASYKIPKKIYFVDRLPRNSSKKLIRYELLNMLHEYGGALNESE